MKETIIYIVVCSVLGMPYSLSANKVFDSKMEAIVGELKAAVKSGKLSARAAKEKWALLQGEHKEAHHDEVDLKLIGRKIKAALAAGKISDKEAHQKWEVVKNKFGHRENEDYNEDDFD